MGNNFRVFAFMTFFLALFGLGYAQAQNGLTVDESGNVGIGTANPAGKLDVVGNIRAGNSDIYFTKTDHNHTGIGNTSGYAALENAANYDSLMILGRAGTSKGRYVQLWDYLKVNGNMDITGNLGIGTTNPIYKLQISTSDYAVYAVTTGSSAWAGLFNGAQNGLYGQGGTYGVVGQVMAASGGNALTGWGKPGGYGIYTAGESNDYIGGHLTVGGKLTVIGTLDPPCELYDPETRESIADRVMKEIEPDKLDGAVLFFNRETSEMEMFLPKKGEFRSLQGEVLESVKPITFTFETVDRYYLDQETGELQTFKVRKVPKEKYAIKSNCTLDPETGTFYQIVKDENGVETDRVPVTKAEAIEKVF